MIFLQKTARMRWRLALLCQSVGVAGVLLPAAAFAQNAETQLEQDRRRLGNSGPLVSEVDPATVRDSMRAAEAAASKNDEDHPDLSDH
ncbi:carbohydrate porin, partial [Acetobacter fabarum]